MGNGEGGRSVFSRLELFLPNTNAVARNDDRDLRFRKRGDDGLGGRGVVGGGPGDGGNGEPNSFNEDVGEAGMATICAGKLPMLGKGTFERREMGDHSVYGVGVGDGVNLDDELVMSGCAGNTNGAPSRLAGDSERSVPPVKGVIVSPLFVCACPLAVDLLLSVR